MVQPGGPSANTEPPYMLARPNTVPTTNLPYGLVLPRGGVSSAEQAPGDRPRPSVTTSTCLGPTACQRPAVPMPSGRLANGQGAKLTSLVTQVWKWTQMLGCAHFTQQKSPIFPLGPWGQDLRCRLSVPTEMKDNARRSNCKSQLRGLRPENRGPDKPMVSSVPMSGCRPTLPLTCPWPSAWL